MYKCEECKKDFDGQSALEQHNNDKHKKESINKGKKSRKYIVAAGLAVALLIVAYLIFSPKQGVSYSPILGIDNIKNYMGAENASVVIEEFSDYQCPFCGVFAKEVEPLLVEEYVDTGKVKIVFKDFPLPSHNNAQKASEAVWCAGDQGKFWEMHDALFRNQNALGVSDLKRYASGLGLDAESFSACLDSGFMSLKIRESSLEGRSRGVDSTPYFFVNGYVIVGAQDVDEFRNAIDSALNSATNG